jgi:hypothetical protein
MADIPLALTNEAAAAIPPPEFARARRIAGLREWSAFTALTAPVVIMLGFIGRFSTAMPLTDEWFFLRAVIAIEQIDFSSRGSFSRLLQVLPWKIYYHDVIAPFLLYWPTAEISGFDNRALLMITVVSWVIVLLLFRYSVIGSAWWTVPVAVILFSPARYMEFLWGWQFTQVLSVLFPLLGLVVLGRTGGDGGIPAQLPKFFGAMALILLGTLCSAGGFFGFPGAIVMLLLQRLRPGARLLFLELVTLATLIVYFMLMRDSGQVPVISTRNMLFILTALGSVILGMPDAFREFALDARSVIGAAIVLLMALALLLAARRRILAALALPAGIFTFSICSVAAISVAREYLGNWHLEYAVPAVCACYAGCYIVFRELRSVLAAQLCLSAALLMGLSLIAWFEGFAEYGPSYNAYIGSIERYARTYLGNPGQPKPFPGTGGWDLDANMVWILAARHHPVFAQEDRAILSAARIPANGATSVVLGSTGPENAHSRVLLAVSLPATQSADALILDAGGANLILRKTDPRLIPGMACPGQCFTAIATASRLRSGITSHLSAVTLRPAGAGDPGSQTRRP